MKTNFIIIVLLSIALFSCSSTKTVFFLEYSLKCDNCGSTKDNILDIQLSTDIKENDILGVTISNLSDEPVVVDERLMSFTDNSFVIYSPIGLVNPNETVTIGNSYSNSIFISATKAESKFVPYAYKGTQPIFGNYMGSSKTDAGSISSVSSYSISLTNNPYLTIPPKSKIYYEIRDYFNDLFRMYLGKYTYFDDYRVVVQVSKITEEMHKLIDDDFKIFINFRLLNETNWRTTSISFNSQNIYIKNREVKY